jgi:hypothetical protein
MHHFDAEKYHENKSNISKSSEIYKPFKMQNAQTNTKAFKSELRCYKRKKVNLSFMGIPDFDTVTINYLCCNEIIATY